MAIKVIKMPAYQADIQSSTSAPIRNGIMSPAMLGDTEIRGRLSSLDKQSYFDLTKGELVINDGSNDRIHLGYDLNGY